MPETDFLEALSIFLLSAVKFMWAPGTSIAAGFTFWQTIIITSLGGMVGILFFYYFGHLIFMSFDKWRYRNKPKKLFTKRSRRIITVKERFGLIGFTFLTPAIISIPIGCVIAAKFFYQNKQTLPLLLGFTIVWSFILTIFSVYIKDLIFG